MPRQSFTALAITSLLLAACSQPSEAGATSAAMAVEANEIASGYAVRGQITVADLTKIAAAGYKTVVNNRPDGEEDGQPTSAVLEAESRRLGLRYVAIPVDPAGPSAAQARQLAETLKSAPGPVLAFCRSGKRAAKLKQLADTIS
ncbi:TIGR01244 family sulfur transferase [Novosphingobium sp.]|uniref:TIGR01244 family sulfur transferase n=1 Tax=Novosphingobium sp. TaxID=1874826 RepID=UPI0025CED46B|nr:TIGR01244 family sulfur transferase [Novosphingobium sp.]MCC6926847.1 TIGR01244 family phosphatase [Novosphingobium sp.]